MVRRIALGGAETTWLGLLLFAEFPTENALSLADRGHNMLLHPRDCFKTVKVTRQGYRQGRPQPGNRELSSHIWWQSGGCFSV